MGKKFIALWLLVLASASAVGNTSDSGPAGLADASRLNLRSAAALIFDEKLGRPIYGKNADALMPIASITKLMTAMVVLDSGLLLSQEITIDASDLNSLKGTRSRLRAGMSLTRYDLLMLALMASENRAAAALARAYPGGATAFVARMNQKAKELGMQNTRFADSTGLSSDNVSTAQDLVKLVDAGTRYKLIRDFTTTASHQVEIPGYGRGLQFRNSNALVRNKSWDIGLSKTGFINESGRCLVMQAQIAGKPVIIVLLDSWGRLSRIGDANRIKKWMESGIARRLG